MNGDSNYKIYINFDSEVRTRLDTKFFLSPFKNTILQKGVGILYMLIVVSQRMKQRRRRENNEKAQLSGHVITNLDQALRWYQWILTSKSKFM